MANFIGLVYATLKEEGIDTSKLSTDQAVEKFKELQEKKGNTAGSITEANEKEIQLSDSDKEIIDDAIYWAKKKGNANVRTVFEQLDEDMAGFRGDAYKDQAITEYIREKLGDATKAQEEELKNKYGKENVKRSSLGGGFIISKK